MRESKDVVGLRIDPLVFSAEGWLFGVRLYLEQMRRAIPIVLARETQEIERRYASLPEDELTSSTEQAQWEETSSAEATLEHSLPRVLAYSFVVALHAIVERFFVLVADRVARDAGFPFQTRDLWDQGIRGAKSLLKGVRGIELGEFESWSLLDDVQFLRNRIVHGAGAQGDDAQRRRLRDLVRKYPGELDFDADDDDPRTGIEISLALCDLFVEGVDRFFRDLFLRLGIAATVDIYSSNGSPNECGE